MNFLLYPLFHFSLSRDVLFVPFSDGSTGFSIWPRLFPSFSVESNFFFEMAVSEFVRDNLDAFSFNMIIICILNVFVFLLLFIMTMPLPDVMKRGYANVAFFFRYYCSLSSPMRFPSCSSSCSVCTPCSVYASTLLLPLDTIYKLVRNIHNFHMSTSNVGLPPSYYCVAF